MATFEKCCSRFNFLMFVLLWKLSLQQKKLVHVLMDLKLKIKTNGHINEKCCRVKIHFLSSKGFIERNLMSIEIKISLSMCFELPIHLNDFFQRLSR